MILYFQVPVGRHHLSLPAEPPINKAVKTHHVFSSKPASPITSLCLSTPLPSFHYLSRTFSLVLPRLHPTCFFIVTTATSPHGLSPSTAFLSTLVGIWARTGALALTTCFCPDVQGQVLVPVRAQLKRYLLNKAFFEPPPFGSRWNGLSLL